MGRIVTVASGKGGVAKTTVVAALASYLAGIGYKVAVVDADPNQTFARWHKSAYGGPAIDCSSETSHEEIVLHCHALAESHDVVFVDTAGWGNQTAGMAIGSADFVLIPCMPDRNTILEAAKTARQTRSYAQMRGRDIPLRVIRTRWNPRGLAERAALDDLAEADLAVLDQHISLLSDYQKMTFTGVVPTGGGRAGEEIAALTGELIALKALPARPATTRAASRMKGAA